MLENFVAKFPHFLQPLVIDVLFVLYTISPFVIPFILLSLALKFRRNYKRFLFRAMQNRILMEIRVPKEIKKSPLAMELFLGALHQPGGEGTWYDRSILGKSRTWFSLEMVSLEGNVRFFIWTEAKFKKLLESQLYAQYPGVEIFEVPDYTKFTALDLSNMSLWGNEFILTKDDPYPIKTYIDYGLDRPGIEDEEKIDPMSPVLEFLGAIGKGEQIWIQIMVRAHKKNFRKELAWKDRFEKMQWSDSYDWTEKGKDEKKKLLANLVTDEKDKTKNRPPTKVESQIIEAVERNITKPGFDCGIRGIYIAEKDKFNPINITGMTGSFKQYNSGNMNGFRPNRVTGFDYPWQDYKNTRLNKMKNEIFNDYKKRAYFYYPHTSDKQFVLSSEELATIFHLPSKSVETPTFSRIESKKSEPPANLPF
ncbi:TPA: hypothetical protein DCZ46_02945 [Candidatus Campbellbacteria bacterium]|nr:MAG: protein of unknown function with transmembrane region [Candidatus Campbellbacteria bacterium GW2011_OD1_34_28]KKP74916.1 MAG: hypothetical protein UR74_C0002G0182 [Candidatus Campbellbacteria bacterium GW2011_GWD2_35_24]KKP75802.1 MAG: hypothetical protein UR75_C0002G0183 [Candidatus Campbellbacteria bacterium GW2011_GWC2_35_28]KKP76950.1 MAG: hypothetical protein UR76_C0002G0151 [Candidatus Campbellbacteria bacterium GW2011_GWC1_35_31]KKP78876.1 MAG: hypothetical protein UR79_C0002G015